MAVLSHKDLFSEIPKDISDMKAALTQLTLNSAQLMLFAEKCDVGLMSGSNSLYNGLVALEKQISFMKKNIRKRQAEIYNHKKKLRQVDENDEVMEPGIEM